MLMGTADAAMETQAPVFFEEDLNSSQLVLIKLARASDLGFDDVELNAALTTSQVSRKFELNVSNSV
jgi:hypothetical protein